ncbi:response regulator, partial [Halomonas sp. BBD48]|nr:response regulator [Halomonas sp. BBD48]
MNLYCTMPFPAAGESLLSPAPGQETGLGRPLAYRIVHEHHGHSQDRTLGTRITCGCPEHNRTAKTPMPRILIVDDEAIIRTALRRLLERHDYQISEAGSVAEALEHDPRRFDLILSDLRLPDEAGTALIEAAAPTPVVIMTSYASMRSAVDTLKLGAVDYVAKPFDQGELLDTVAKALEAHTT